MFWLYALANEFFVLAMYLLARQDKMDTPQSMESLGYHRGVPFLNHGGALFDGTVMPWVVAEILTDYAKQWRPAAIMVWFAISTIFVVVGTISYTGMSREVPNFTAREGVLMPAGYLHTIYSILVLGLSLLFFFGTHQVIRYHHVVLISLVGVAHLVAGFVQPAHHEGLNSKIFFQEILILS